MTFWEYVRTCFRKYADLSGRASRAEDWWCNASVVLVWVAVVTPLARGLATIGRGSLGMLTAGLVMLALAPPFRSAYVRRCHDRGRSGWTLWPLVDLPEGDPSPNRYGPPPGRGRALPGFRPPGGSRRRPFAHHLPCSLPASPVGERSTGTSRDVRTAAAGLAPGPVARQTPEKRAQREHSLDEPDT
jgi:hypothetical protein